MDGTSCKFLKAACPAISTSQIPNKCLFSGTVPQKWKMARVTQIFKGGDREEISNYRPISILPQISKIIRIGVNNQLYDFLNRKDFSLLNNWDFDQITLPKLL